MFLRSCGEHKARLTFLTEMAHSDGAPFLRLGAEPPASPVLLSVPHAGRDYSDALLGASRLPLHTLEVLEDRLVDRLIWRAVAAGCAAIVAQRPRAEIDLNRDEREIEPATVAPPPPAGSILQSLRTRSGLGLIPSRIAGSGAIWTRRIEQRELQRRIDEIHAPYHHALASMLREVRARFGIAILLDCHSMPPGSAGRAGIVLGDRHGTAIAPALIDAAADAARAAGYEVAINKPYAGGHITARHGRPSAGIHALQLEIDRALYLDEDLRSPGASFDAVTQLIESVAQALADRAIGAPALAAE